MKESEITAKTQHDLAVALNIAHLKGEVVEFMFRHQNYAEVRDFVGSKVCGITGAQHLMLTCEDGTRSDWFGEDAPDCCRKCVKASANFEKDLPPGFFAEGEAVIVNDGDQLPDMNLPRYCPMRSSVIAQFRKGKGLWRMVADYTKPHSHNMQEVARGLRVALEFLSITYAREDDLPGLIDLTLHRLMELTECDYIAIHSVDGDHRLLYPSEELKTCPGRCEACSFYKLVIPPVEDADHIIELTDTKRQTVTSLPSECPAKSLEVAVVYCDGKPWGGIALHYVRRRKKISEEDRCTLKIAAGVLKPARR